MEYLFILGRNKELCLKELESVFAFKQIAYEIKSCEQSVVYLQTLQEINHADLMNILGGTIKIAKVRSKNKKVSDLIKNAVSLLSKQDKKTVFGLSWYSKKDQDHFNDIYQYSREIKNLLATDKKSIRYILPKEHNELSSVVIEKQKIREIIVYENNNQFILAETLVVQNFADWNKRDYQRPVIAPDKGMLPPKVARMMVNIGRGKNLILLDPFCGMGTILAEGLLLGLKVYGSDQDQKAIDSSKKNLDWLSTAYNLAQNYKLFLSDATHISEKLEKGSVDLIVTEPYLGPLMEFGVNIKTKEGKIVTPGYIERIVDGLERMYQGCLKDWSKILTKDGIVVIVFPSYLLNNKEYFVKRVVDNCEKLGYSIEVGPLPYSRPQAIVKRNIYILKKKTN